MDPLTLFRFCGALIVFAVCWQGAFATFPYGFGPWFIRNTMFWIEKDGLHWSRGRRFHK